MHLKERKRLISLALGASGNYGNKTPLVKDKKLEIRFFFSYSVSLFVFFWLKDDLLLGLTLIPAFLSLTSISAIIWTLSVCACV